MINGKSFPNYFINYLEYLFDLQFNSLVIVLDFQVVSIRVFKMHPITFFFFVIPFKFMSELL